LAAGGAGEFVPAGAAGVAGADVGAVSPDDFAPGSDGADSGFASFEGFPSPDDFGLALPYPSAYQPPPLKEIAGAEITRLRLPPQWGHPVISASENFWRFSVWR